MKNKLVSNRSSYLIFLPVLLFSLLGSVLAAFFHQTAIAFVLMFLFLVGAIARLWAFASARNLSISVSCSAAGLFPDEEAVFDIEVRNGKFLPVLWLEAFFPLAESQCLLPEDVRDAEPWEVPTLAEAGVSTTKVGEKKFKPLLWYDTQRVSSRWRAVHRGVYSTEGWRLRTGDGFGLAQAESALPQTSVRQFVVYPRLVRVSPQLFLRNLWNADTGTHGVMEDPTVIRSTRDYMTTDSLKRINWRLTARGLPLSVNVYEDILPKNVHFLFDGESFSGPEPHPEEMEDALSILGSEFVRLADAQVRCGVSLCRGKGVRAINIFDSQSPEELLCALAAYQPMPDLYNSDKNKILPQQPAFDLSPILQAAQRVGRFYYIAYDTASLHDRAALKHLDHTMTSILTYREPESFGEYETVCLSRLKEGSANG